MIERFMIDGPDRATEVVTVRQTGDGRDQTIHVYEDANLGDKVMWTAAFPLPEIGDWIYITMNGIGYAQVQGYFASHLDDGTAYIGTMSKAICPPKWLVDQQAEHALDARRPEWSRRGLGCEFGTEIRPLASGEAVPTVEALTAERKKKEAAWKRKLAKERKAEKAVREARWAAEAAEAQALALGK